MRNNGVTFKGADQVIKAYEMNEMPVWSIWSGNNMPFVSEEEDLSAGADMLKQALDMIAAGGSESTYTLKVYKSVPPAGIKSNTPWDRSFNFSIFNPGAVGSPFQQRTNTMLGAIDERFMEMKTDLLGRIMDKLDKEDEEEENKKPGGIIGFLNGFLEDPQIKQVISQQIGRWVGGFLNPSSPVAAIGGIEQPTTPMQPTQINLPDDQVQKINQAISILAAHDNKLGDHLLKLAAIARDNPGKYKMALTML